MLHGTRVLVPLDFSEFSRKSLSECSRVLSGQHTREIHFLYVWRPPSDGVTWPDPEEEFQQQLSAFTCDCPPIGDSNVFRHVACGHPAMSICEFARDHECDLIVISTHGRTGLKRMLMGSTAEQVVRHAPCAVVVLRGTPTSQ